MNPNPDAQLPEDNRRWAEDPFGHGEVPTYEPREPVELPWFARLENAGMLASAAAGRMRGAQCVWGEEREKRYERTPKG